MLVIHCESLCKIIPSEILVSTIISIKATCFDGVAEVGVLFGRSRSSRGLRKGPRFLFFKRLSQGRETLQRVKRFCNVLARDNESPGLSEQS